MTIVKPSSADGGAKNALLKVLDRVCEAGHPLVLADQHGGCGSRNLAGESHFARS
jgi:hypothetical protein